ncbi:MAG TPA: 16S rRNA (adenine(1518)-N(6)/adenine(1519)-N(6))-dimethyltransferase RsmA [Bacillota bacterium]|nr:16S rRNA (adenine(1518)-N(6)/adenine(1519)-N(6))-dimethyltransferase RsmA [Peptococcaceae bacterium MAG4]NLW37243.1 16S rRNA (adenine(1518)-N(6)/adenine(1519)-N(6))-dimethyltransferase RsmA [Peptococcaceae bacterium]HPZ42959.1 16S rRNA (adenine(1518)-N(6)/adenine(1519)-N(6))-dimethyltransferase RsmA [Bacillota bacterium]HQD75486.1 16S rRNA (adenine(1518)-N(6)/adenine(1519)-N(6))-dimethyltransferase RsmA [Bacillota bacterium]HUM58373.1 16S rRNA (adenine(1518)-N(6)/adenine(1519)-N(6))-dimethyl
MVEITSPSAVRAIISRYGLACRKSLGQNFLVDQNIINKIINAADLKKTDFVVEIGPGLGALTVPAARKVAGLLAVEVDRGLQPVLAEILAGAGNVEVIWADALEVNYDEMVERMTGGAYGRGAGSYKLLSNIPYAITSPLLIHLLTGRFNFSLLVVMVQLEVAARLVAAPGDKDYGALSVFVQYYTRPEKLFRVPRTVFYPPPGVDSEVVRLVVRPRPAVEVRSEGDFFRVVRAAFGQRRKTLLNALSGAGLAVPREAWQQILEQARIDPGRRGETLSLQEFAALTECYLDYRGFGGN